MEYTKRRNLNRGYMKLDIWQRGLDLYEVENKLLALISSLESKRANHDWNDTLPISNIPTPSIH